MSQEAVGHSEDMVNLGWANDWEGKEPGEVSACAKMGHKRQDVDLGPPNRGLEHFVSCKICGYFYKYDSSD